MMKRTMAIMALAITPAVVMAQQDTTQAGQSSADRNRDQQNQPTLGSQDSTRRGARGRTTRESRGSIAASGRARAGARLSRDQVTQLQEALESSGCNPGAIDGIMGARTRRAMACARTQNGVTSNDENELYRSLNLSFGAETEAGMGANQGRVRPPADSATDSSAAMGRPPREAQEGRGMHDSTTSTNRARRDTSMMRDSSMNRGSSPDSTNRPPR